MYMDQVTIISLKRQLLSTVVHIYMSKENSREYSSL